MSILEDNATGANTGDLYPNLPLKYLTATSLMTDKIYNLQEEHMGQIKDIMIDLTTGKIEYFVVEFGGFLGIGVKYFALPFRLFQVDADKKRLVFNQKKEMLEKAPGFDMEHWPQTNIHFDESSAYWSFMG